MGCADDGESKEKARTVCLEREEEGAIETDRESKEDGQRADWEHVKLPGGRCDSPKQQSNHLKQCFNEAAWGG